ncbi:hypothetical protein LBM341_01233 [Ralstonia solanacearum]|nr:hypothetical protein LBM341_01233 [Ralstonia solanacearum]NKA48614.1 hypothetical protein [Ralstonia solanacearum]
MDYAKKVDGVSFSKESRQRSSLWPHLDETG